MKNSRLLLLHLTFTINTFVTFYDYYNWGPKETKISLLVQVFLDCGF